MRVVVQRVKEASVSVKGKIVGAIGNGLLILAGFEEGDSTVDLDWMAAKVANMRVFDDANGVMNLSLLDVSGEILCISQFTLYAQTKKGNRPSYIRAAKGAISEPLYNEFCKLLSEYLKKEIKMGIFGADMQVNLLNNGPVTICIDSKNKE